MEFLVFGVGLHSSFTRTNNKAQASPSDISQCTASPLVGPAGPPPGRKRTSFRRIDGTAPGISDLTSYLSRINVHSVGHSDYY